MKQEHAGKSLEILISKFPHLKISYQEIFPSDHRTKNVYLTNVGLAKSREGLWWFEYV